MSARRTALHAAYWTTVLLLAALVSLAALPFTGPTASTVGVIAAAAVCLVGSACAPSTTRKDHRS